MKVVLRADASLQIGTGHVMRCLTLAEALAERDADCRFICREHAGNLIEFIRSKGYTAHVLPVVPLSGDGSDANQAASAGQELAHSHWLGATQAEDAQACAAILSELHPDWLIVDHYALDARWEQALKPHYRQLMVIDDLADRPHLCDLLLDQTFGRDPADYLAWVPTDCKLLCGSQYALLRPEFAALRPYSLQRRTQPRLRQLLVTMGGVDKDNATGQVLQALRTCALPPECQITVVMGPKAPWLEAVRQQAQDMPWPTRVLAGVSDMARLMADSDLAIGAAGATSWERCCLGLPTAMVVLADNQRHAARLLEQAQAVRMLDLEIDFQHDMTELISQINNNDNYLCQLCECSSGVSDGKGCERAAYWLTSKENQ